MKILSVGSLSGISNTCLHRHLALKEIADHIDEVNTTVHPLSLWYRIAYHLFLYGLPIKLPENNNENEKIIDFVNKNKYDIIWIDKGLTIKKQTLLYIKQRLPNCKIVSFSPDNMVKRHNQSQQFIECIPLYDFHITTKSFIIEQFKKLGATKVLLANKGYNPQFHYPRILSEKDYKDFGGDVGFVGTWEKERCQSLIYLATHGIKVRVFGSGKWEKYINKYPNLKIEPRGLYKEDYVKSLQAFKISLCFLRKINGDLVTARSIEIPACGGFMLAERTKEHQLLFKEGIEADFFSNDTELLEKCKYYLSHEDKRKAIALKGCQRCKMSDYTNKGMIKKMLRIITSNNEDRIY